MAFCTGCGNEIPAGATACPNCSQASASAAPSASAGGLTDNVAGALAYLTFIPAIIFLVMEPYSKNRFIRFHSFQCLFLVVACIPVNFIVGMVPIINLIGIPLLIIGEFAVWVILVLKAYQGQKFKLPVLGDIAEKQANA